MIQFENLVQILAKIMGVLALSASSVSAVLLSRRARGRSSGKGATSRNGSGVLIMTIGFVAMGILLWKPVPLRVPDWLLFSLTVLGTLLYFCGIGLYLWGLGTMRSQFAVSGLFGAELYKGHKLVTNGPFALVRHPLYVGVILSATGALFIFRTWAMVLFMPMSLVVV